MPNIVLVVLNLFAANLSYSTPAVDQALINQAMRLTDAPARFERTHNTNKYKVMTQAQQTTRFEDELKAAVDRQNLVLDLQIRNYYIIAESA